MFCVLWVSCRLAARGDSMPTKIVVKFASRIRCNSSSSCAMLSVTSVIELDRVAARRAATPTSARSSSFASFLLPMKLSSTTKTLRTPRRWIVSISAMTCATVLVRGRRPYITMMSQNSQLNGQPRANWIVIVR